jgi:hypothetical protein
MKLLSARLYTLVPLQYIATQLYRGVLCKIRARHSNVPGQDMTGVRDELKIQVS